jgi:hypothetical protein
MVDGEVGAVRRDHLRDGANYPGEHSCKR